jgi:hypothetical protein
MNPCVRRASTCGSEPGYFLNRLQETIKQETKTNGLIATRLFPAANKDCADDDVADEARAMNECLRSGNYTDVTEQPL